MKSQPMNKHWLDELDRWSTPIIANLLWIFLSALIITLPLAVLGLLGVMYRWMEGQNSRLFTSFWGTIRRNWWKAYLLALIDIAIGSLIYVNLMIFQMMDMSNIFAYISRGATGFIALMLIVVNFYAWTLIAVWDAPFKVILKFSIQLVFAQPLWTLLLALLVLFIILLSALLPIAFLMVLTGALVAYVICRGTRFVAGKYIPAGQFTVIDLD